MIEDWDAAAVEAVILDFMRALPQPTLFLLDEVCLSLPIV